MKLNEEGFLQLVQLSYLFFSSKMFWLYYSEGESQWLNVLLFVDLMESIDLLYLMKLSFLNLEPFPFVYHLTCWAQSLVHFGLLLLLIFWKLLEKLNLKRFDMVLPTVIILAEIKRVKALAITKCA